MAFGITGQSSKSSTSQTDSNNSNSDNVENSNNTQNSVQTGTLVTSTGPVNISSVDGGILDTAGSIVGAVVDASRAAVETSLSLVQRVVESGFGSAQRSTDIVSQTSAHALDQVATAEGKATLGTFDRYGIWIIGGVLALIGAWIFTRKGK